MISALLPLENSLSANVPVNTVEKPLSVTLPTDSTDGTCYIGTRANEDDPWHYSLATDGTNANTRFIRLSAKPIKTCIFDLYRLNIQFRLFVFNNEEKKDEVQVDSLTFAQAEDVEFKDGKYIGKLTVKLNIEGENLNSLKAEDLIAKITYRSENQNGADVNFVSNQTDYSDKAVSGSYEHSFVTTAIKINNSLGNTAELSFELNLDGINLTDFPTDFLVEFYSKAENKDTLPFSYTQAFSFETKEKQDNPPSPLETYTITLDPNGGTVEYTTKEYNSETEDFNLPVPTKDGFTFTGWTGSNGDTPQTIVAIEQGSTGDRSYTANWSAVAYTITYNLNGGTENTNPQGYNSDTETFELNEPTKTGYTFIGWTGSNGDVPQKPLSIVKGSKSDMSFTANWAINSYMLTLNLGTGIATVDGQGLHEYNSSVTASCTMLTGYQFDKWIGDFTTETFTMPANNATMTANAKVITYSITYNGVENCTFESANPTSFDVTSANINLKNPNKNGYEFTGWTGSNGDTPQTAVSINTGSTENRVYTANFNLLTYNIALDLGEGSIESANPIQYNVTTSDFELPTPSRNYYNFLGWSLDNSEPANPVTISQGTHENRTYTAKYAPSTYTITLAGCDGATIDYTSKDYNVLTADFTLPTPTKDYYGFNGWVFNGGDPVESVTIAQGTHENRTYTADFTPSTFTITLNPDDGTVEYTSKDYNIETPDFMLPNPTKTGNVSSGFYIFGGWQASDSDTATTTLTIPQGSTGDREYTAKWILLEMKPIAAGNFMMGSPADELCRNDDETKHQIIISQLFYMGTYEVTQAQYKAVKGINPSYNKTESEEVLPVECVSWIDIMTPSTGFIDKINLQLADQLPNGYKFDLPTEAQWEYACRAGTTKALNNDKNLLYDSSQRDENLDEVAWYFFNWGENKQKSHSIGSGVLPNSFGLYDMHGNVEEWCKDLYDGSYYQYCIDNNITTDPQGPEIGTSRLTRGGNCVTTPKWCRSAARSHLSPEYTGKSVGFRLVLVAVE